MDYMLFSVTHALLLYCVLFFNDTATTEIYTYCTLFPHTTLFRSLQQLRTRQQAAMQRLDNAMRARRDARIARLRHAEAVLRAMQPLRRLAALQIGRAHV